MSNESPINTVQIVTVLFMEISDQDSMSEPVGMYTTGAALETAEGKLSKFRTYRRRFVLNDPPVDSRGTKL